MLYVVDSDNRDLMVWHIGKKMDRKSLSMRVVFEVNADGDELEYIRTQISGLPLNGRSAQRWFGDDARFIVATLMET